jgi:hypothetical protein
LLSKENELTMKRSCQCVLLCSRKLEKEFTFLRIYVVTERSDVGWIKKAYNGVRRNPGVAVRVTDKHYTECEVTATRLAQLQ